MMFNTKVSQLSPLVMQDGYEVTQLKEAFYNNALTPNLAYWGQANTDTLFYAGQQTPWSSSYGNIPVYTPKQFNFNIIKPIINTLHGQQIDTRKTTVVVPVEGADQQTADQLTKALFSWTNQEKVLETISDGFLKGSLITGLNLLHLWVDYSNDPISGDLKCSLRPYNSFIMDPYWTKMDGSDWQGCILRDFLPKKTLVAMFPDIAEQIVGMQQQTYAGNRDNKFQYMPQNYDYSFTNLMIYDQFYYRDYRLQKMAISKTTGESVDLKNISDKMFKEFMRRNPDAIMMEQNIPTVRLALFIGNQCIYDGPSGKDFFPLVPIIGYRHEEIPYYEWRITSVTRSMRDPQYLYNRFIINMSDQCESQINSGYIYKPDQLINPEDVYKTGQGKSIALKSEANITDIQKIQPGEASASSFKLSEIYDNLMNKTSGVNEVLLGQANDDLAGITHMLRQGAALKSQRGLYDNIERSQQLVYKYAMNFMQEDYMPFKIEKMIQEQPTMQFFSKEFGKYDIVLEDGFLTSTQKQQEFAQLYTLKQAGVQIPDSAFIRSATVQNKGQLLQEIQQAQQAQQQQAQQRAQVEMQELQAREELARSRAFADKGLGAERLSRIEENQALAEERRAQAVKDEDTAALNFIKAIKEIQGLDLQSLATAVNILQQVKQDTHEHEQGNLTDQPQAQYGNPISSNS